MVNFPTWILDFDSHSPAPLNLFISSNSAIYSTMFFPPLGDSDCDVISISIYFSSNSKAGALIHRIPYDYSCADLYCLHDHFRGLPWEDIFKLSGSAADSGFCQWFQAGTDVYITHFKYQV